MVIPLKSYSSRTIEGEIRNSMMARRAAIMPFGAARGRRIYEIRSAADLMVALQEPYLSRLTEIQLGAIETALLTADWSDARERVEQRQKARAESLDRCRAIARVMMSAGGQP